MEEASAPSSAGASCTTSSRTASGSSSVARRLPVRASCCASAREDRRGEALGGPEAAGGGQLLRERPQRPLGLEEPARLDRAGCRAGKLLRELETVVREPPLLGEEREHEADLTGRSGLHGHGKER